ncbi:MAG: hypothetical protein K2H77_05365, partial [Alistipes sp.]|nr:hypothetical protein [Alistipes sp.]
MVAGFLLGQKYEEKVKVERLFAPAPALPRNKAAPHRTKPRPPQPGFGPSRQAQFGQPPRTDRLYSEGAHPRQFGFRGQGDGAELPEPSVRARDS